MTKLVAGELEVGDVSLTRLKLSSQIEFLDQAILENVFKERNTVGGRAEYTTGGSYTFVVPAGVKTISALAVGAGGGGAQQWANSGASGGGLAWYDNIDVEAGDTISITVAGQANPQSNGATSSVGSYFSASGGQYNSNNANTVGQPVAGTVTPNGGKGGWSYGSWQGGGGGAGGYTGNGGNGWYGSSGPNGGTANGSGGAGGGGGGYASSTYGFGGGGGVGIRGEDGGGQLGPTVDPSQQTSPFNSGNTWYSDFRYSGPGGSGGEHGGPPSNGSVNSNISGRTMYHGEGGNYGGGGAGAGSSQTNNGNFGKGGAGAVVIVYSTDPNFSIGQKH
jgi:hypothetical protein